MDHTPYRRQKQHEDPWSLSSQPPTNKDVLTNDPMMTGWFSGPRRQRYSGEPTKIGVSYRTRRRRHYDSPGDDSDVSVISYNSGTTFGRFSQNVPQSPRLLSPSQETQPSDFQETDSSFNQRATQPNFHQYSNPPLHQEEYQVSDVYETMRPFHQQEDRLSDVQKPTSLFNQRDTQPSFRQYSPRIQPLTQNRESNDRFDANTLVSNSLGADHHMDIDENDDTPNWTIVSDWKSVNDGKSLGRTQRQQQQQKLSSYPTKLPGTTMKQAPYVNDKDTDSRNSKFIVNDQFELFGKSVETAINREEDKEYKAGNQKLTTDRQQPHLRHDNLLETLSWTKSKHTSEIESRKQTAASVTAYPDEQQNKDKATLVLSQKALGKRRLIEVEIEQDASPMDRTSSPPGSKPAPVLSEKALGKRRLIEVEKDALSIDMEPLIDSNTKERSPSVLSFHYNDNAEEDHDYQPPPTASKHRLSTTIQQKMKRSALKSPSIDYGENDADMGDYAEEEQRERLMLDTPRINTKANLARKLINGYHPQSKMRTSIPITATKSLFESALPPGTSMTAGCTAALLEATNLYFEQLRDDLEAYATHCDKFTIDKKDLELLMTRQRLVTENISLESLAYEHLPRELWDELCVSALAHNVLHPHHR